MEVASIPSPFLYSVPSNEKKMELIWLNKPTSSSSSSASTAPVTRVTSNVNVSGQIRYGPLFSDLPGLFSEIAHGTRPEVEIAGQALSKDNIEDLCHALEIRAERARQGLAEPIRTLKLTRCGLDNAKLARVLKSIPSASLRTLGLWWNAFDSQGFELLLNTVTQWPELSQLDLYGNVKLTSAWPAMSKFTFHNSLSMIGLGGTAVHEKERDQVRERLRTLNLKRTRVLSVLVSSHYRVGKASTVRVLPTDLLRALKEMLYG